VALLQQAYIVFQRLAFVQPAAASMSSNDIRVLRNATAMVRHLVLSTFPAPSNDDQFYHDGQHSHTLVLMRMPLTRL
jgi:hypothetical protein